MIVLRFDPETERLLSDDQVHPARRKLRPRRRCTAVAGRKARQTPPQVGQPSAFRIQHHHRDIARSCLTPSASRHIGLAVEFLRFDSETAAALQDAHSAAVRDYGHGLRYGNPNGTLITDPVTGEAATGPAGVLRAVERDRSNLLGKGKRASEAASPQKPAAAEPAGRDWSKAKMTGLFMATVPGDATAKVQIDRFLAKRAGKPDPTKPRQAYPRGVESESNGLANGSNE